MRVWRWDGNGPICLLLHGFGEGSFVWHDLVRSLMPAYRFVAVDLRGHGESGWDPRQSYCTQTHLRDVMHIVQVLGLDRFAIVGHSLGASIGIHLATADASRVLRMIIVDYGIELNIAARDALLAAFRGQFRTYHSIDDYADYLVERRPLAARSRLRNFAQHALRSSSDRGFELKCDPYLADSIEPELDRDALSAMFEALQVPALLIRGAASSVLLRNGAVETLRHLRRGSLSVVSGAGHAVMIDNPDGFVAAAKNFLLA